MENKMLIKHGMTHCWKIVPEDKFSCISEIFAVFGLIGFLEN
jgi:hypothetical protein